MEHDYANIKRGALASSDGKTRLIMYLDDQVVAHFREVATENGRSLQSEINASLNTVIRMPEIRNVVNVTGAPFGGMVMSPMRMCGCA